MDAKIAARFWAKVNKDGPVSPYTGTPCWVWTGAAFRSGGYGAFCYAKGDVRRAHVLSYEDAIGHVVAKGLVVRHACHNPSCVNPAHLSVGTQLDNVHDSIRAARTVPPPTFIGVANRQSKLTDGDVRTIRASADSGPALARRFGVDHAVIYRIRKGTAWRHVV